VTLIPCWDKSEAARYIGLKEGFVAVCCVSTYVGCLETFKSYEFKDADLIRGQQQKSTDYAAKLANALTAIKSVNKADVKTLNNKIGVSRCVFRLE
jgi:hypothetical protein